MPHEFLLAGFDFVAIVRNYRELVGEVFVIQGVPHVGVGKHRVRAARLVDRIEEQPALEGAVGVRRSGGRRSRCEIRRKRPRGIAGSGRQALAAAKLPPVEDFKPSVLNQQGKWDLPLGRQRRSSPPSAPSSRPPITVEKGWPTSAPAMSSLVSAAPESVASYSTSKTGKLLPAEFMNASASKQPVLTWTANARESKVARLVGIPVRTRRTSSPPVDRPAHWPQTAFEEIMMSPASPGCALPQRRLGARVAR